MTRDIKKYVIDVYVTKKYVHLIEAESEDEAKRKLEKEISSIHDDGNLYEIETVVVEEHD